MISTSTLAFSEGKSEKGKVKSEEKSQKGKGGSEKDKSAATTTTTVKGKSKSAATTTTTVKGKSAAAGKETKGKQTSSAAQKRHTENLAKHAPTVAPLVAGTTYELTGSGTAKSISGKSVSVASAPLTSLSISLSIWKSTKGLVSFDVLGGSVQAGGQTFNLVSGSAIYVTNSHMLLVVAFTDDPTVRLLKLQAKGSKDSVLSAASGSSETLNILSPQSKLASKWFLEGTVNLSVGAGGTTSTTASSTTSSTTVSETTTAETTSSTT